MEDTMDDADAYCNASTLDVPSSNSTANQWSQIKGMMHKHLTIKKRSKNQLTWELLTPFVVGMLLTVIVNQDKTKKHPQGNSEENAFLAPFDLVFFAPYIFMF